MKDAVLCQLGDGRTGRPGHRLRRKSGSSSGPRGYGGRFVPRPRRPARAGRPGTRRSARRAGRAGSAAARAPWAGCAAATPRSGCSRPGRRSSGQQDQGREHSQHPSSFSPGAYDDRTLRRGRGCAGSRVRSGLPGPRTGIEATATTRRGSAGPGRTPRRAARTSPTVEVLPAVGEDDHRADRLAPLRVRRPHDHRLADPGDVAEQGLLDLAGSHLHPAGVDDVVHAPGPRRAGRPRRRGPWSSVRNHRRPSRVTAEHRRRSGPARPR